VKARGELEVFPVKAREADLRLVWLLGGLALSLEAGLRAARATQARLLDFSAESKRLLGARVLPSREDP
jgi:hypothetical protein